MHDLRAEHVGPDTIHTGMHIDVPRGTVIDEEDRIAGEVRERIREETGCLYCVIHVDPANGVDWAQTTVKQLLNGLGSRPARSGCDMGCCI